MSTRGNYTGAHVRSLSPHTCTERGVSGQSRLTEFLFDFAAATGAVVTVFVAFAAVTLPPIYWLFF